MFDTLKKMFFFDDPAPASVPTSTEKVKIKDEPKISEPVISFVEVFKKNPRRFKITWEHEAGPYYADSSCNYKVGGLTYKTSWNSLYRVTDRKKGICFVVRETTHYITIFHGPSGNCTRAEQKQHYSPVSKNLDWITSEEFDYVQAEISKFLKDRAVERKNKLNTIQRNKYIRHYCEQ